jgi:hypothetical protein
MPATVSIVERNGSGSGTPNVVTVGRYCTNDSYNPGDTSPCVVPTSGNNYSWWKSHALKVTGTDYTKISNIRVYGPTDIVDRWDLNSGKVVIGIKSAGDDSGCPTGSYDQAAGTENETGYDMNDVTNGHTYYKSGTTNYAAADDLDNYSSASPLLIDATEYTSTANPSGFYSKMWVTQVVLATDSIQGDKSNITIVCRYDEI